MNSQFKLSKWQLFAWATGLILSAPLFFLLLESLQGDSEVFSHLWDTVLWDYILNTVLLVVGVSVLSCVIALPLGWPALT